MIRIPLTKGYVALVDDEDADLANAPWHALRKADRYPVYAVHSQPRGMRPHCLYLHLAVWARAHPGEPMPERVDHISRDGLDCRRGNLRAATHAQNMANAQLRKDNASGFRGVCFNRGTGRWKATLSVAGRTLNLGEFTDPESAAKAYDAAALKHRGTFAVLNFPRADGRAA